jgi:ligand-binding SRPBCC domain-containing protein
MQTHVLETSVQLRPPPAEVFPFFANAHNLDALTPAWLHFEVLTPPPIAMHPGALIDYRLRWHGIPLRWRTEILEWEPPLRFVDRQVRGPYRLWHHEHRFEAKDGGTRVIDRVEYAVPGGILGAWIQRLFVSRDVKKIFDYRTQVLQSRFGVGQATNVGQTFLSADPKVVEATAGKNACPTKDQT